MLIIIEIFLQRRDSMKAKKIVADTVAKIAKAMAVKSCGAASMWGTYEPKVPDAAKALSKKITK